MLKHVTPAIHFSAFSFDKKEVTTQAMIYWAVAVLALNFGIKAEK